MKFIKLFQTQRFEKEKNNKEYGAMIQFRSANINFELVASDGLTKRRARCRKSRGALLSVVPKKGHRFKRGHFPVSKNKVISKKSLFKTCHRPPGPTIKK